MVLLFLFHLILQSFIHIYSLTNPKVIVRPFSREKVGIPLLIANRFTEYTVFSYISWKKLWNDHVNLLILSQIYQECRLFYLERNCGCWIFNCFVHNAVDENRYAVHSNILETVCLMHVCWFFPARFVICGKLYVSNQNLSHRCDLSGLIYPIFYNYAAELSWSPSLGISAETSKIFKKYTNVNTKWHEPGLQPSHDKKRN